MEEEEEFVDNYSREDLHKLYIKKIGEVEEYVSLVLEKDMEISLLKDSNEELKKLRSKESGKFEKKVGELEFSLKEERRKSRSLELKLGRNKQEVSSYKERFQDIEKWSRKIHNVATSLPSTNRSSSFPNNTVLPPTAVTSVRGGRRSRRFTNNPLPSVDSSSSNRVVKRTSVGDSFLFPEEEEEEEPSTTTSTTSLFSVPKPRKRKRNEYEKKGQVQQRSSRKKENTANSRNDDDDNNNNNNNITPIKKRKKKCSSDTLERPHIDFTSRNEKGSDYIQRILHAFIRKYSIPPTEREKSTTTTSSSSSSSAKSSLEKEHNMVDIFRKYFVKHVTSFFEYLQEKENLLPSKRGSSISIPPHVQPDTHKFRTFCIGYLNGLVDMVRSSNSGKITLYLDILYIFMYEFLSLKSNKVLLLGFLDTLTTHIFSRIDSFILLHHHHHHHDQNRQQQQQQQDPRKKNEMKLLLCSLCLIIKFLPNRKSSMRSSVLIEKHVFCSCTNFIVSMLRTNTFILRKKLFAQQQQQQTQQKKKRRNKKKKKKNTVMNQQQLLNLFNDSRMLMLDLTGFFMGGLGEEYLAYLYTHDHKIIHFFLVRLLVKNQHQFFTYVLTQIQKKKNENENSNLKELEFMDIVHFFVHLNSTEEEKQIENENDIYLFSNLEEELIVVLETFFLFHNISWLDVHNRFFFGPFFDFLKNGVLLANRSNNKDKNNHSLLRVWCHLVGSLSHFMFEESGSSVYYCDPIESEEDCDVRRTKKIFAGHDDLFLKLMSFFKSSERLMSEYGQQQEQHVDPSSRKKIALKIVCANSIIRIIPIFLHNSSNNSKMKKRKRKNSTINLEFMEFVNDVCLPYCREMCRTNGKLRSLFSEEIRFLLSKVVTIQ